MDMQKGNIHLNTHLLLNAILVALSGTCQTPDREPTKGVLEAYQCS